MNMEFEFKGSTLKFYRVLSDLDKLVLKFVKLLHQNKISYVIISGYVALLFGRSRDTEDVDLFIEECSFESFKKFWEELHTAGFYCINAATPDDGFFEYLQNHTALRFAVHGTVIPNFEVKFPKTKYNRYSLEHKLHVILNGELLETSEIELQLAFKLYLGSDKDFEDARHLYQVFKEHLNIPLLEHHIKELNVEKQAKRVLWRN